MAKWQVWRRMNGVSRDDAARKYVNMVRSFGHSIAGEEKDAGEGVLGGSADRIGTPRTPGSVYFDTPGGVLLETVATSPELLARALSKLLGDDAAADLLAHALHCITGDSIVEAAKPAKIMLTNSAHDDGATMTENSAFADEEDLSREQLQIIKARTMFNMVEEIDDGKSKLLFLTNPQAELIASTPESVQKMLDALEVPKQSLVIEFLETWGFRGSTKLFYRLYYDDLDEGTAGMRNDVPPFLNFDDEAEAEAKIDMFMSDVLIPLAAQTHAVVLCSAVTGSCMLSTSFLRMYSLLKNKWSGPPPFTVISITNDIGYFYRNPAEDAHWKTVRRASRAWRQRDAKLFEVFGPKEGEQPMNHDLDANASLTIITDCIHPKRERIDWRPFSALKQALIRHLSSSVPSLAIRTGFSKKVALGSSSSIALDVVSARAQSGTPVLALDVRNRAPLTLPPSDHTTVGRARRQQLIDHAKSQIAAWRASLLEDLEGKEVVAETLDVCTLAYLHEVLTITDAGLSSRGSKKDARKSSSSKPDAVTLHEALRRVQVGFLLLCGLFDAFCHPSWHGNVCGF